MTDQLNASIEKMFPFCHALLYAIVGTLFHASAVVTNDGAKSCSLARTKNSQCNPGSSCDRTGCQIVSPNPSTTSSIIAAGFGTRSSISREKSCPSPVAIGQPQVTQSEDWYKNKRPPVPELDTTTRLPLQHELMSERRVRIGLSIRIGSVSV
jgi:hypothetical protein